MLAKDQFVIHPDAASTACADDYLCLLILITLHPFETLKGEI